MARDETGRPATPGRDDDICTATTSEAGGVAINIRLKSISDLFVSFDPSPLVERDIDNAIEAYIVDIAIDAHRGKPFTLVLLLPPEAVNDADTSVLTTAVRNYFAFIRDQQARRMKRLWRDGRQALAVGLIFLAVCMGLGQAAFAFNNGPVGAVAREGLIIVGWVANWKPIEIFLYDWRPIHRLRRVYDELSRLTVEVRPLRSR
jgi:hypothetical protein